MSTNSSSDEKEMSFIEHLDELRTRIIYCLVAIVIATVGCCFFSKQILNVIVYPLPDEIKLNIFSLPDLFMIYLKIAFLVAIFISSPIIFYQLWKFVSPGLLPHERSYIFPAVVYSVLFFIGGAIFAFYFVLPIGVRFFLSFQSESLNAVIEANRYISFVMQLILAFGLVFELPIIMFFLTKLGIVTPKTLRKKWRYAVVIIFVVSALLTPADIFSQLAMALPLILLYEIGIWVSKLALRKPTVSTTEEEYQLD